MAVHKRGKIWWYKFTWNGEPIRESTKQGNKRVAEQMEAAHRTMLAKGEVGIRDSGRVPTLRKFADNFEKAIETRCADKPATVSFYRGKLKNLLSSTRLAGLKLDRIDEEAINTYVQDRTGPISRYKRPYSVASVNRELATLRRLLRLAHEWRIIGRVPKVGLLRGENVRDFVLSQEQEAEYLAACAGVLRNIATVLLDTGLRVSEALTLEWPQVRLTPAKGASFGYLTVLAGKSKNSKARNVPLSARAVAILQY